MKYILLLLLLAFTGRLNILTAQHEGDQWVIGYTGHGDSDYSIMFLDFRSTNLKITHNPELLYYISGTQANICTPSGVPLLWTNGMEIISGSGKIIADTIAFYKNDKPNYWNYNFSQSRQKPFGFPLHNGALILPSPNSSDYSVFYHSSQLHPDTYFQVSKYLEARIRYNPDSSFTVAYQDSLFSKYLHWYSGPIKAVRHANGRDWWAINFQEHSPYSNTYLFDQNGIRFHHTDTADVIVQGGLGQTAFSNDGKYLARMDAITIAEGQYITLYSFDRCNGQLRRLETFHTEAGYFTGVAFSPSDRYLYADDNTHLWQWDLWSDDINSSQTLIDTFDGFIQPGWFEVTFAAMMNAPDGRIYIISPGGSSKFMHVINHPDLGGASCDFRQHSINLPYWNGRTAPNIPNFRLGPLDGSDCDTLGLNNHPISWWRYEDEEIFDWYTQRFTDLSYYDPETWYWDFGDGSTTDEQSPVHTFEPGLYHVCLTVSNSFSSDSMCQWMEILTTDIKEAQASLPDLSIDPNPFSDELIIHSRRERIRTVQFHLYDIHGRLVFHQTEMPVPLTISMPSLLPGMYYNVITEQDGSMSTFTLMKI